MDTERIEADVAEASSALLRLAEAVSAQQDVINMLTLTVARLGDRVDALEACE